MSCSKVKVSDQLIFIIRPSIAAPQCLIANWDRRRDGLRSKTHELLSKHSRLSPLERALCSLFFANIASLYPPPAALRRRCPRSQIACSTAARLLETCSTGFIKSLALPFRSAVFDNLQRQTFHCRGRRLDTSTAVMPRHPPSVSLPAADKSTLSGETP